LSQNFREFLAEYIKEQAKPPEKYGHQPRLYALTQQIGAGQAYDDDVVYAAAWLHDLGVFVGHRPEDPVELSRWDNTAYAVQKTPEILLLAGFPTEKIPHVLEAIRTHQPHNAPQSVEAAILRDADILEQLGAIGVLRTVCKVGRDTRHRDFSSVVAVLRSVLRDLPARLQFERAQELAKPRIEILSSFLTAVDSEAVGGLF
jgi:uncharacterized protein